jgi:glycosyltransferase involved in cell wall biosynthesis
MSVAPMTILHVIAQLRYGAGRVVVDTAVEQAVGLRHMVKVCLSVDTDENWSSDPKLISELASHNIEVRRIGDFFHRRTDLLHDAAKQLRSLRSEFAGPVVVHAHTAMAAAAGHWARPDALVATCHGWAANRPDAINLQDAIAYQLCDSILTYSRHWADRLVSDLAADTPIIIPMGLNLEQFPRFPTRPTVKAGTQKIVTVCELIPRKGVDVLIHAMPFLWATMPELELHIIGGGESASELRLLAEQLDPGCARIQFHGAVPHPYQRLLDYNLFALASRSDNLPVVLLEAMLAGLPIVVTRVGGAPDLISAAGCGVVVAPGDSRALAEGISGLLHQGWTAMVALGNKGERFCRLHSDVKRTALQLNDIYMDACRKRL